MPRQARKKSECGIYHIMLRGINRQQIFEDAEDYYKFLAILKEYKEISEYSIYAYCLMGNHIHLLLREGTESLEQVFKRICGKFVYWYNVKYQRTGHLFQDRFKSEPVDTQEYLQTVIRYIHQNPVKAKLCKHVSGYAYSSYAEYLSSNDIVDTAYIFGIWSLDEFVVLNETAVEANCLDITENVTIRLTDEQASALMRKISKCENATQFQSLNTSMRDKYLKKLREKGVSIRQLSRLTGISVGLVRKFN